MIRFLADHARLWLAPAIVCLTLAGQAPAAEEADVIVYGATPGGFCAAIAAAREGASVVLLEPTNHVGGVNTGGLCFSDSNQTIRSTVMGLFDEWHTRIEQDYASRGVALPYKVSVKDHTHWTYEPHVAARVTKQMLNEAKVKVLTDRVLTSVKKTGPKITHIETSNGTFAGKVYIDGTYEGDLMAAAHVSWTIGREGRDEFGESLAGKQYGSGPPARAKSKMPISGFDENGRTLPLITGTSLGADEAGDANVMVYSFRLCLTKNPKNRVPMPAPANYDPARFEVVRRHLRNGGTGVGFDRYPLPGDKLDGNNSIGGQFSLGFVGACNGWCEATPEKRREIWEAHKQYTLEFYHFLTTDPAVPEAERRRYAELGLCRDEFPEHGHFSPALYVREGRRMQGLYVVTQNDVMKTPEKDDAIAVSSFPIDSHDCQRVALPDGVVNEGTMLIRMGASRHGYPYHIPYRAILPKPSECENLLVPVALSCTHVAISSIRVEPTWMIIGQSAGVAAALAAKNGSTVHNVPYSQLRERLIEQKQVLEIPAVAVNQDAVDVKTLPGIVLDDATA
ncbi:MAG TPA: FAD-dependent oxidoreductase, partial [Pirellulales bacterium]